MNLAESVENSIRARKLFSVRQRILVAVSGGLDSVVLLRLLHALAAQHRWKLTVAHLNHQLRGRASDGDERFVRALARRLKLPCITGRINVRAQAKKLGLSIEMAARKARHEFLARTTRQLRISSIALAHHADDQVELFFLRLFRGTSTDGLAGMKWRGPSPVSAEITLVRPLLDRARSELAAFARENKIRFREDASNASRDILRNRIRHELLPLLRRRFQPAVNRSVLRLMEIAGAESEALADLTQTWLKSQETPFDSLSVALQRRIIHSQLQRHSVAADFDLVERLRTAPNQAVSINPLVSVVRNPAGEVGLNVHEPAAFNTREVDVSLKGKAGRFGFDGVGFRWRFAAGRFPPPARCGARVEYFDADAMGDRIVLRHWRPGDRFQPIGLGSSLKLQDWFTNQKVPRARRRELIVATTATGEVFWVEGLRISERFKLTPGTRRCLIWRWERQ